jgi:hypothetical protein
MRRLSCAVLIVVVTAVLARPALAEDCDKLRPTWAPLDGAVGQLGETAFFARAMISTPVGWVLAGLLAASFCFRRAWVDLLCAAALLLVALAVAADWWLDDPTGINAAAPTEGCRTAPVLPVVLLSLLCLGMLGRAFSRRSRRPQDAAFRGPPEA